ncbi:MAG: IclR family transcriptional regulator [Sphingomonas sp.]
MASKIADSDDAAQGAGGVMAIRLVLEVLERLASRESVGVTELARGLGTTKPRVFRHLRTLVDQGYALQNEDSDRYFAGPRLIALARAATLTPEDSVVHLARPTLQRLRDEVSHTVNLSLVYGDTAHIVETLPGRSLIDVVMRTHASMPLHSTAAGKLLLAERLAQGVDVVSGPFEKYTVNTIVEAQSLRLELERIQQQGWAVAPEETVLGINALSAPVRDHRDTLVAMVSVLGSIQFIARQPSRELIDFVRGAAQEISDSLKL